MWSGSSNHAYNSSQLPDYILDNFGFPINDTTKTGSAYDDDPGTDSGRSHGPRLNAGEGAGIALGALIGLELIALGLWWVFARRRKGGKKAEAASGIGTSEELSSVFIRGLEMG